MKYTYQCPDCSTQRTLDIPVSEYSSDKILYCHGNSEHKRRRMKRVYDVPSAQYIGDGFTGAAGSLPHMDKNKREKDLASPTDVEGI